jgi:HEAT repeats/Putative zinc-finger
MKDKPTNCDSFQEQMFALIDNQLDDSERRNIELHIKHCADCQQVLEENRSFLKTLESVETPSPSLAIHTDFYAMLSTFKAEEKAKSRWKLANIWQKVVDFFSYKPAFQLGFGLFLITMGSLAGYFYGKPATATMASSKQIETLSAEVQDMKQIMMLQMLENPAATERMKAVSYTEELNTVDDKVIDALLTTLNHDESVNVRLMTLEALAELAQNTRVREGLVQSLIQQKSPLIQAALADLMVKLQEKRSVKSLKEILEKQKLDESVKTKLEQSIKSLT